MGNLKAIGWRLYLTGIVLAILFQGLFVWVIIRDLNKGAGIERLNFVGAYVFAGLLILRYWLTWITTGKFPCTFP